VDPICTFLFGILVIISTLNVLKDTLRVVMEGKYMYVCGEYCVCIFIILSVLLMHT